MCSVCQKHRTQYIDTVLGMRAIVSHIYLFQGKSSFQLVMGTKRMRHCQNGKRLVGLRMQYTAHSRPNLRHMPRNTVSYNVLELCRRNGFRESLSRKPRVSLLLECKSVSNQVELGECRSEE